LQLGNQSLFARDFVSIFVLFLVVHVCEAFRATLCVNLLCCCVTNLWINFSRCRPITSSTCSYGSWLASLWSAAL
jgi:hypothetical protein